ncbi:DUF3891 family protein [Paenibacillus tarimensis]
MIVRETDQAFYMIKQHDHAHLSGQLASGLSTALLADDERQEEVLLAVYEHDRSHIRLDDTPVWNDRTKAPFSFSDYPLLPKLTHYKTGLDEIEAQSRYAGLLCSLHYASFFPDPNHPECIAFVQYEQERQERIIFDLQLTDWEAINKHFLLLQLCDDLSLYVCLNEPGAAKEREHPWYRDGIKGSELFNEQAGELLTARWLNEREIVLTPFPFKQSIQAVLKAKNVMKSLIYELGIEEAYRKTEMAVQEVVFCGPGGRKS